MPRHPHPWTQKADELLRQAVVEGRSIPYICRMLGRTQAGVRPRAQVLGLSLRLVELTRRKLQK